MKCEDASFLAVFTDKQTNNPNHNIPLISFEMAGDKNILKKAPLLCHGDLNYCYLKDIELT